MDPTNRLPLHKHLLKLARKQCEDGADMIHLLPTPEELESPAAKKKAAEVVAGLRQTAEQIYMIAHAIERAVPVSVEMSGQSIWFLRWLGVPVTDIAEKADIARGTVYSKINGFEQWACENGEAVWGAFDG